MYIVKLIWVETNSYIDDDFHVFIQTSKSNVENYPQQLDYVRRFFVEKEKYQTVLNLFGR